MEMPMPSRHFTAGKDYDPLRDEAVHDPQGTPITTDYIEDASREAEAGYEPEQLVVRGRPSLSGEGDSPQVRFRVPATLRDRAQARAAAEGKSLSELARDALVRYLAS